MKDHQDSQPFMTISATLLKYFSMNRYVCVCAVQNQDRYLCVHSLYFYVTFCQEYITLYVLLIFFLYHYFISFILYHIFYIILYHFISYIYHIFYIIILYHYFKGLIASHVNVLEFDFILLFGINIFSKFCYFKPCQNNFTLAFFYS